MVANIPSLMNPYGCFVWGTLLNTKIHYLLTDFFPCAPARGHGMREQKGFASFTSERRHFWVEQDREWLLTHLSWVMTHKEYINDSFLWYSKLGIKHNQSDFIVWKTCFRIFCLLMFYGRKIFALELHEGKWWWQTDNVFILGVLFL